MPKRRKSPAAMNRFERLLSGWCPNCAQRGSHYVPPGSGTSGFFMCEELPQEEKNDE